MRLILTISFLLQFAYGLNVKNIAALKAYKSTATEIVVTDFKEYGIFYRYNGTDKEDGGVIIADGLGRLWQRIYNPMIGVNVWWFGAKGDGVNNDKPAFDAAFKYCTIPFTGESTKEYYWKPSVMVPDGLYRFASPFYYGGQPQSAKDALSYEAYNSLAPSYRFEQHLNMAKTLPISITFGTRAYIWGDFVSDTLTPIVSLITVGYFYGGYEMQSTKISGLKIMGRNKMDYRLAGQGTNQVGLLLTGNDIIIENLGVYGVQEGFIHNSAYFNTIIGFQARNCQRGYYSIGSHNTRGLGMRADHCKIGIEIRSGASNYDGISTEQCSTGLIIGDGFNSFEGLYLEQLDNTSDSTEFQLQIGYKDGHPLRGTSIKSMTIAGGNGILINNNVYGVSITGSTFVSSSVKTTSPINELQITNSFTDIHSYQQGKITYPDKPKLPL